MAEIPAHTASILRLAVDLSPTGMIMVDEDGHIVLVNRELERMFGYRRDELIGASIEMLVPASASAAHPDDRRGFMKDPKARPMGAGRELFGRRKDGTPLAVEIGLNPVEDAGKRYVLASVLDISARRGAEQRFHAAFESSPHGMIMTDGSGTIVLVNREVERLFGYARAELIGRPVEVLVPDRFRHAHPSHRAGFMHDPRTRAMGAGRELFGRRKDGTELPIEIGLNPVPTDSGAYVLSSIVDITHRKRAEQELRDGEERFRTLVENVRDYAIYLLDPQGRVASWNAGAERIEGYATAEILGAPFARFFTPEDVAARVPEQTLATAEAEGRHEIEGWRVRKDGSRFFAAVLVTALRAPSGRLRGFVKFTRDITQRRELESQLLQAQKMEAIGTLAGGIAHDFNNILGAIVGYAELVKAEATTGSATQADLDQLLAAAERGRHLVQRILAFSRQRPDVRSTIGLEAPISEAMQLMRATVPTTIDIQLRIDEGTPQVFADPTQIHQVVMNLATNAAHAMAERGGSMEVALSPVQVDTTLTRIYPELQPGLHARLRIVDTGSGIPPEILDRVLEPFFTTKPPGQGSGIGLAMVHGIVRSHGGIIGIRSTPHLGTTVDVYLPAAPESIAVAAAELPRRETPRGRGQNVLLVDDEPVLAQLGRRTLEHLGYRVTVTTSSPAALDLVRENPKAYDLVLTDYTMPHLTGTALAESIHDIREDLPVVMMSGYREGIDTESLQASGIVEVLGKPVTSETLAEVLHRVLGARAPDGARDPELPRR